MKRTRETTAKTKSHAARTALQAAFLCLVVAVLTSAVFIPSAYAQCVIGGGCCGEPICCQTVVTPTHNDTRDIVKREHKNQREEVFGPSAGELTFPEKPNPPEGRRRLQHHERWLIDEFFEKEIQPALMMMTEQMVSVAMQQMLALGAFLDAEQQFKSQRLFQELAARAHKDYQPSFGMCEIGTNTRSIAAAELNGDLSRMALNKRFLDRQLGNLQSVGGGGPDNDRMDMNDTDKPTSKNRLGYFLKNTCDDNDLNKIEGKDDTGLFLCKPDSDPVKYGWMNRDIDWNNTVMSPRTINVDYTTTFEESASDNERILEMANYLYGHRVFSRPDGTLLNAEQNQDEYLDSRAVTAKRSVAQNTFNAIVALKTRGTRMKDPGSPDAREMSSEETSEFARHFLVELGFPEDKPELFRQYMSHKREEYEPNDAEDKERDEMSYYAQMEVLAKKVYERPEFYTDLYDKPANIARKSAAMQAIKLMLDRDIFDSQVRSESLLSMILELKVVEEQQRIENRLELLQEVTP